MGGELMLYRTKTDSYEVQEGNILEEIVRVRRSELRG